MHIAIFHPCHCCGQPVDLTLPENRGLLVNMKAYLQAQIITTREMLERCKTAQKLALQIRLHELEQQLKGLP